MAGHFESPAKFRNAGLILLFLLLMKSYKSSLKITEDTSLLLGDPEPIFDSVFTTPKCRWSLHELSNKNTRKKYLGAKISRYPNSESCFQLLRIAKGEDVALNPGPPKQRTQDEGLCKIKCQDCTRTIARNHRAVQCKMCELWFHIKCARILPKDYKPSLSWICTKCILDILPSNYSEDSVELEDSIHEVLIQSSEPNIILQRKKNQNDLLLVHLNINSIQNKFEELRLLNEELKSQIIFLTETKIDSTYTDEQFALKGYNIYRKDRKKGGGGIMAYISTSITPQFQVKIPGNYKLVETLAIKIKTSSNKDILFIGMYRPPKVVGRDYYNKLEEELNTICMWATMNCSTVIITGDLNLDRLKPLEREGKILIDLEDVFNLSCLISQPTRVTNTTASLLDVILTNDAELFKESGVLKPEISDHHMVYGLMNEKVYYRRKVVTFRSTKNLNIKEFQEEMKNAPWDVMDTFDTLDDAYDYWKALFNSIVDKYMPLKKMRFREKDVPYMTPEWKEAIKLKRTYAQKYASNRTQENWDLKKKWRNNATKFRRKAIKQYWLQKSKELKTKPRKFYQTFKPFINNKGKSGQGRSAICIKRDTDGFIESDRTTVANTLADYFSTMANSIGGPNANHLTEQDFADHSSVKSIKLSRKPTLNDFQFETVECIEIKSIIENLNTRKACGSDNITPMMLKLAAKEIAAPLSKLYNKSIQQGIWPDSWKKGIWCPVFKKDDRLDKRNYRPITLLTTVDKIYEKLLSNQINNHFESELDPCISAYRKQHSCETTLISLTEEWRMALDRKESIGLLSTDMTKAFDSLHPSLMINKLKAYKFSDRALELIRSYFQNRVNRVKLQDVTSEWKESTRGCPQGSSFGPLLWNLFQNDMTYMVKKANLSIYADDHQIYTSGKSIDFIQRTLNEEGQIISKWYNENLLQGNYDKYNAMLIGDKNKSNLTLNIDGVSINSIKELKLLGVTLDDGLNFSAHISITCKKAGMKVGVLSRLRNLIPTQAKLQLYLSAILPHLTYCHVVWHFGKATDCKKLERVQERALRAVFNDHSSTYNELLNRAKLPSLFNRRLQDILILMYKVKNKYVPDYISNIFYSQSKKYNLRNSDFCIPSFSTVRYGKHSIRYLGPFLWSKINKDLRNKPSINAFRMGVRTVDVAGLLDGSCQCVACST